MIACPHCGEGNAPARALCEFCHAPLACLACGDPCAHQGPDGSFTATCPLTGEPVRAVSREVLTAWKLAADHHAALEQQRAQEVVRTAEAQAAKAADAYAKQRAAWEEEVRQAPERWRRQKEWDWRERVRQKAPRWVWALGMVLFGLAATYAWHGWVSPLSPWAMWREYREEIVRIGAEVRAGDERWEAWPPMSREQEARLLQLEKKQFFGQVLSPAEEKEYDRLVGKHPFYACHPYIVVFQRRGRTDEKIRILPAPGPPRWAVRSNEIHYFPPWILLDPTTGIFTRPITDLAPALRGAKRINDHTAERLHMGFSD